jgi:hypothetical protein
VHLKPNARFKIETSKFKKQVTFTEHTAKMANNVLPFSQGKFWDPIRERLQIEVGTFPGQKDYFALNIEANFTMPDDEFFLRHH